MYEVVVIKVSGGSDARRPDVPCDDGSVDGRQHVVVVAAARGVGDGETRPYAADDDPGAHHRGGHGQAAGARPRREGLCCRVLV